MASLIECELSVTSADPTKPLLQQDHIKSLATTLYDQYGEIDPTTRASFAALIVDNPIQAGTLPQHLVFMQLQTKK